MPSPGPPPKRVKLESSPTPPPGAEDDYKEHCIICLQDIADRTVLPNCAHEKFCFECVVVWTEQSRKCPLCQQEIGPYLIHHVRSQFDYQKYFLPPLRLSPAAERPPPRSSYRQPSTRAARARVWGQREDRRREEEEQRTIEKRRWVYRHHLYAKHVASNTYTKYRPHPTPSQFASQPDLISRTTAFVKRELSAWNNIDADFLTTFVISLMKTLDLRSETAVKLLSEFLDMGNPYVEGNRYPNAEHFAHEVYSYVRSPFRDLTVYDRHVQYDSPPEGSPPFEERPSKRWANLPQSPRVSSSRRASNVNESMHSRGYRPPSRSRSRDRHRSGRRSPSQSRSYRARSPARSRRSRSPSSIHSPPLRRSRSRSREQPERHRAKAHTASDRPERHGRHKNRRLATRSPSPRRRTPSSPRVRSRESQSPEPRPRTRTASPDQAEPVPSHAPHAIEPDSTSGPTVLASGSETVDAKGKGKAIASLPPPQEPGHSTTRPRPPARAPRQTALSSIQAHLGVAQNGAAQPRRVKIDRKPLAERIADDFPVASAPEDTSIPILEPAPEQDFALDPVADDTQTQPEAGPSRLSAREIMARTRARLAALKAQDCMPATDSEESAQPSEPAPQMAALRDMLLTRLEEEKKKLAAASAPPASDAEERRLKLKARLAAEKRRGWRPRSGAQVSRPL